MTGIEPKLLKTRNKDGFKTLLKVFKILSDQRNAD